MDIGIVGLPNVGKSSLFNALTNAGAQASNYPFTTIEPNVGVVPIPDKRLDALAELFETKKVAAYIRFVDIAGIVEGASKGEGLGNKFLANIREVDAIIHVVRLFEDENVVHVSGSVDPLRDVEIIETELMLADLESVEKMLPKAESNAKSGNKEAKARLETLKKTHELLKAGKPASLADLSEEEKKELALLTLKPMLYVGNNSEKPNTENAQKLKDRAAKTGAGYVELCVKLEAEIAELPEEEKKLFLAEIGSDYTGLEKIVRAGLDLLNLSVFFTAGKIEARSWLIPKNCPAPRAAGKIHSDIERGFICAEIYNVEHMLEHKSAKNLKEKGLLRQEGRDYLMSEGDVCDFKFNV
ncbi:MAG: redox-regulated ATPase YchF [Elusimicrobiota bacterium]|jgi:GTP-binding protein YchF|nr:redox-regulated ATPase YchF [Elusimicrobiota bacterium]